MGSGCCAYQAANLRKANAQMLAEVREAFREDFLSLVSCLEANMRAIRLRLTLLKNIDFESHFPKKKGL